jgi:hypothetical protein
MTRWLSRLAMAALVAAAAASAGCPSAPTEDPGPSARKDSGPGRIMALSPADMSTDVTRRPVLKWRLPENLRASLVSVAIYQVGTGAEPKRDDADAREMAFASGVMTEASGQLDPLSPPGSVVLTGDLRGASQLAPLTWYKWKVRANTGTEAFAEDSFYFRTGSAEAPMPLTTQTPGIAIPPMPQPLPPQPIEKDATFPAKKK